MGGVPSHPYNKMMYFQSKWKTGKCKQVLEEYREKIIDTAYKYNCPNSAKYFKTASGREVLNYSKHCYKEGCGQDVMYLQELDKKLEEEGVEIVI